jgi:F0F1-type ATP synthase assembly protein I
MLAIRMWTETLGQLQRIAVRTTLRFIHNSQTFVMGSITIVREERMRLIRTLTVMALRIAWMKTTITMVSQKMGMVPET